MSGEHLWSAWIGELLGPSRYDFVQRTPSGEIIGKWHDSELDVTAKVVCEECNNGWMSDIEGRVKPVLESAIRTGKPMVLTPEQVKYVANFCFKGALVASLMNRDQTPFYPVIVYDEFRLSLKIPVGIQMWAASVFKEHFHGIFSSYCMSPAFGILADSEFNVFTFSVGFLLIQALVPRWKVTGRQHEFPPILAPNKIWRSVSVRFWPNSGFPVAWPPEADLDGDSLEVFKKRWLNNIEYKL